MKVAAIVCEYNPFHNGHLYQINEIKRRLHADYIVAVMSGDFVQRGIPAFCDKYERARFALSYGIDLVLELPVCYASASAEGFAYGAISLLNSLNFIDTLVFGAESEDLELLKGCAHLFLEEPPKYRVLLQEYLKAGLSFPLARSKAACEFLSNDCSELLKMPNNILGIEYIKALLSLNSNIKPYVIQRKGGAYHDLHLDAKLSSASSIRSYLSEHGYQEELSSSLPKAVCDFFSKEYAKLYPIEWDDISDFIFYRLLMEQDPSSYLDYHEEMYQRLQKTCLESVDVSKLVENCKSKNFTHARISRYLLHLMLEIKREDIKKPCPFAKVLGIKKNSTALLKIARQQSNIPIVQKVSWYQDLLSKEEQSCFEQTLRASKLYRYLLHKKFKVKLPEESRRPFLIV